MYLLGTIVYVGIERPDDWHLCRELHFLGYVKGDPELASRAVL